MKPFPTLLIPLLSLTAGCGGEGGGDGRLTGTLTLTNADGVVVLNVDVVSN